MKHIITYLALIILFLTSCINNNKTETKNNSMAAVTTDSLTFQSGYSEVNGLKMYYEIYGQGKPLVLIHGGGSARDSLQLTVWDKHGVKFLYSLIINDLAGTSVQIRTYPYKSGSSYLGILVFL